MEVNRARGDRREDGLSICRARFWSRGLDAMRARFENIIFGWRF